MPQNATLSQDFERSRRYRNWVSPRIDHPISEAAAGLPEGAAEWDTIESESVATLPQSEA